MSVASAGGLFTIPTAGESAGLATFLKAVGDHADSGLAGSHLSYGAGRVLDVDDDVLTRWEHFTYVDTAFSADPIYVLNGVGSNNLLLPCAATLLALNIQGYSVEGNKTMTAQVFKNTTDTGNMCFEIAEVATGTGVQFQWETSTVANSGKDSLSASDFPIILFWDDSGSQVDQLRISLKWKPT